VYSGDLMSNDVQSHESVVERLPGEERRASPRHAASTLGSVTARIIGGSPVDLVNFSARGVLFECDSRLLIGARASVRITTTDANLIVSGRVVRSRVKGLVNGALRYDAALALDHELTLRPVLPVSDAAPAAIAHANGSDAEDLSFESELDDSFASTQVEAYLTESEASLVEVARHDHSGTDAIAPADLHVEVAVHATLEEAEAALPANEVSEAVEAAADEPIAFESDADVAFEAAGDFVFEEVSEPAFAPDAEAAVATAPEAAVETPPALPAEPAWEPAAVSAIEAEPAGESMFDATPFVPPAEEAAEESSMFETTPPAPVYEASASSMFDARPSEAWRAAGTSEPAVEAAEPAVEAAVAIAEPEGDGIDFETDVTFEADDAVMFESVFEAGAEAAPAAEAIVAEAVAAEPEPEVVASVAATEPLEASVEEAADSEPPATAPDDDRALLPFTATVPQDLADLRRIAADNQW
jgi:hypothetical protein